MNHRSQASLSITSSQNLPKLMSIELVMPSNHLILCRPLLLLPPVFPNIRVFSNESSLRISWPKYWSKKSTNINAGESLEKRQPYYTVGNVSWNAGTINWNSHHGQQYGGSWKNWIHNYHMTQKFHSWGYT